jgi:hypothetical protein
MSDGVADAIVTEGDGVRDADGAADGVVVQALELDGDNDTKGDVGERNDEGDGCYVADCEGGAGGMPDADGVVDCALKLHAEGDAEGDASLDCVGVAD